MQKATFEKLDATVSRLGFGAMRLPKLPDGSVDEELTAKMVDYAYKHGVNYFDTAYTYMKGESERVMGRILKNYPRDSFYFADKLPIKFAKSAQDVVNLFQEQLEKCQVDYFDFYLIHALDRERTPLLDEYKAYEYLCEMRKAGKIRRLGFSFHDTADALDNILSKYDFDFVQVQINYLDWTVQDSKGVYEVLEKYDKPAVVMEPVRGGFLANPPSDVAAILDETFPGKSYASTALRWVQRLDRVKVILSGMSNLEQVADNINTFTNDAALSDAETLVVEKAARVLEAKKAVPCTGCRYCEKCPRGIAIPEIFGLYNRRKVFGEGFRVMHYYQMHIAEESRADHCIGCGYCASQCPQQIDIPNLLKICHEELLKNA